MTSQKWLTRYRLGMIDGFITGAVVSVGLSALFTNSLPLRFVTVMLFLIWIATQPLYLLVEEPK